MNENACIVGAGAAGCDANGGRIKYLVNKNTTM